MRTFNLETDAVSARLDDQGVVEAVSAAWLRLARRRGEAGATASVGRPLASAFGPGCGPLPDPVARRLDALLRGETWTLLHHYADDGTWWRLEVRVSDGGIVATHTRTTSHEHLDAVLAHSPARVADVARDAELVWASPAWRAGRPAGDGDGWLEDVHPTDVAAVRQAVAEAGDGELVVRARMLDHAGSWSESRLHLHARDLGDGAFSSVVVTEVDVTDEVRDRDRQAWKARHDELTGLVVRSVFTEHLRHELLTATRDGRLTGVLFADVDGFKAVNDEHGHLAGDVLLRAVAERIQASTRPGDVVARFGGDEFVVLLPEMDDEHDAANAAQRLLASISRPVDVDGVELPVSMSVGVVVATAGTSPDQVLRRADDAMYVAKREGGVVVTDRSGGVAAVAEGA